MPALLGKTIFNASNLLKFELPVAFTNVHTHTHITIGFEFVDLYLINLGLGKATLYLGFMIVTANEYEWNEIYRSIRSQADKKYQVLADTLNMILKDTLKINKQSPIEDA